MNEVTRRGFITKVSVAGAAAAIGGLAMPSAAQAQSTGAPAAPDHRLKGAPPQDVVLHIRDARTSEVALIAGTEEYVFHDRALVSSVLHKLNKSTKE
jgi:hypothetical protein